jgi:hypothetical protein
MPPPSLVRTIRVTMTRSGRQAQDVEMLRKIHSLLVGHSGTDRFLIRLTGGVSKSVELAFPNETTGYGPELVEQLTAVLGPDAVHVESGLRI